MHWCGEFCDDQETEWSRKPSRTWDFLHELHVPQLGRASRERAATSPSPACTVLGPGGRLLHSAQSTTNNTAIMDWNDLRNQVSNLSVYDLKAGVRKVQNGMYMGVSGSRASSDTAASRHELHRDGVQGARGDQQRAVGSFI